jgi:hypothetical protein
MSFEWWSSGPRREAVAGQRLYRHVSVSTNNVCNNRRTIGSGVYFAVCAEAHWEKFSQPWLGVADVSFESVTSQQGCEHRTRSVSFVRGSYQATTGEDIEELMCYSDL